MKNKDIDLFPVKPGDLVAFQINMPLEEIQKGDLAIFIGIDFYFTKTTDYCYVKFYKQNRLTEFLLNQAQYNNTKFCNNIMQKIS